ncbi:orotate phosphoribosyltransferase [Coxiella endosymbiont of Dermacentor marginatus]|uniref:orotate phosphoribosyltransferase n=1 Tax=Coxiella endosymbiont of Dermacentor marginatus TaxID=1656159 RepID=UPI0022225100|nr:orotate phosphoribosyltransferase [Coxiella endosymbiont of Dermacentor marginatus]
MKYATEIARILLDIKAITLNLKEPYHYSSGLLSPIYCDNRLIISYPEKRKVVIDSLLYLIEEKNLQFDVIAGTMTAGIPYAAWISDRLNLPMVYIRDKAKTYGKKNQIEGKLKSEQKVLVVEDLISFGESTISASYALRQFAIVKDCIAIFSYQLSKAQKNFAKANLNYYVLSNFKTLIKVAVSEGYITEKERQKALVWNKDPENWNS